MIRFVATPDGGVAADLRRRLPGRGVWVTADRDHVASAMKGARLQKALGLAAAIEHGLEDRVDDLLVTSSLGALSLARKAGSVVTGFTKVDGTLRKGQAAALIHAADASGDGQRKLAAAAHHSPRPELPVLRCFTREHLDLAFGRTNVIHAALLDGPASQNVLEKVENLERYRTGRDLASGSNPNDESGTRL